MLKRLFKLRETGTTVPREIVVGSITLAAILWNGFEPA